MPIYDIFNAEKSDQKKSEQREELNVPPAGAEGASCRTRDRFFSSFAARLFFLLLLVADVLWGIYSLCMLVLSSMIGVASFFQFNFLKSFFLRTWISLKRSLVCGISLFVALFSPSFGIMIACTYFLMFDREGIDEVVPASLQEQFKEFFPSSAEDLK